MDNMEKSYSRREFIRTAGAAGAGSLFSTTVANAGISSAQGLSSYPKVSTRAFGKTGVKVSMLGLGGYFDTAMNISLIEQAAKLGINFWETTNKFGGKGYGLYFKNHPGSREKVFLLSKTKSMDPETMVRDLDKNLENIGTSYVDLFVIHAVDRIECLDDRIRKVAERLKREGKIRYFGFTTHSNMEQCLAGAAKLGWIDGIVTTYNYRLMHRKEMKQAVKSCATAGIGLVAIKSQAAMAHPTATIGVETETSLALAQRFMAKGFTLHQAKLKAIWENPLISSTLSMMPNTTILMANAAAAMDRTALSSRDMELLKNYADETLSCYCAGCARICESVAPSHIPIAKVMRCLMYYHAYNDHEKARSCYHRLPMEIRQEIATADYSVAELKCPNRLAIGELLRRAHRELA
jgi:hypothetical protein